MNRHLFSVGLLLFLFVPEVFGICMCLKPSSPTGKDIDQLTSAEVRTEISRILASAPNFYVLSFDSVTTGYRDTILPNHSSDTVYEEEFEIHHITIQNVYRGKSRKGQQLRDTIYPGAYTLKNASGFVLGYILGCAGSLGRARRDYKSVLVIDELSASEMPGIFADFCEPYLYERQWFGIADNIVMWKNSKTTFRFYLSELLGVRNE